MDVPRQGQAVRSSNGARQLGSARPSASDTDDVMASDEREAPSPITGVNGSADAFEHEEPLSEVIVRTLRLPYAVLDPSLRLVSANAGFRELFAGPHTEGGAWLTPALIELLERALREQLGVRDVELEHPGGRHLRVQVDLLERREQMLLLLSVEDVTRLHEARATALRRARELAREHRRKDEFLAMLGHELRNPLAALVNGLSLLEHVGSDPEQMQKIHPILVRQTRRMTVMLDQLLDISQISSGEFAVELRPVSLVDVATCAAEAVRPMIDAGELRLVLAICDEQRLIVEGDFVRLVQVVENLLSNAVKYTESGGTIWLSLDVFDGSARVSVRDTGVGIDAELLPHVFDVFIQGAQRLDRAKGGLGLGLALVRRLVDKHGGRVEASSAGPGRGSEFVVLLPRLDSEREPATDSRRPEAQLAEARPRRVLVVDDEQDAALTLAELLHSYGHDTQVAYDGRSAVALAQRFEPEIVLLDLGLPDIDGYEVAKQIRAQAKGEVRLIAVTGYQRDDARLRDAGFDDHVIKPRCLERISALLGGS
ncbi:MAG: hybrid sensor histidine kinase/response regulator [Enhygromyxa sp.]